MITEVIPDNFDAISKEIWSSMVNIPLTVSELPAITSWKAGGTVTSSVQIVGSWNGAVCLDMGTNVAHQAAACLIGADMSEVSHDDVRDAAGELANMTAGGIKELLHGPCQISLPMVVMGTDFEFSVPQGVVLYRSVFDTEFGPFQVTLLRGEDSPNKS
jgi:chemotaxis protein CheX